MLIVSLYTVIVGSVKLDEYIGCNSKRGKVSGTFNVMDQYFAELDKLLCQDSCPCGFNEYTQFMYNSDPVYQKIFSKYKIYGANTKVTQCEGYENIADNFGKDESGYRKGLGEGFKERAFEAFWRRMERDFECTGVCNTVYDDEKGEPMKMRKFLFRGINYGVPKYSGCMERIVKFIRKIMISFGSLGLATGVVEIILVILSCLLLRLVPENGYPVTPSEIRRAKTQQRAKSKENIKGTDEEALKQN